MDNDGLSTDYKSCFLVSDKNLLIEVTFDSIFSTHFFQGGELLVLGNKAGSSDEGYQKILTTLRDGSAMGKFKEMIKAQGVEEEVAEKLCSASNALEVLPLSNFKTEIKAKNNGVIQAIDALVCAEVTSMLGAGRTKPGEPVLHNVGILLQGHVGDRMQDGETWMTVYHKNKMLEEDLEEKLKNSVVITETDDSSGCKKSRFMHKISSN